MWVHPDLIKDDESWTTVSRRKSPSNSKGKGKAKARSCHVINIAKKEPDLEANKFTDSEDEAQALTVNSMVTATRSGREFAKEYDQASIYPAEAISTPFEDTTATPGPPTPPPPPLKPTKAADKRPEPRFSKPIDKASSVKLVRFDILKQLDQIPARVSLHELLRLSPITKKALREALADVDMFVTQVTDSPLLEVL